MTLSSIYPSQRNNADSNSSSTVPYPDKSPYRFQEPARYATGRWMGSGLPGSIAFSIRRDPSEGEFRRSRVILSRGLAFAWAVKSSNKTCVIFIVNVILLYEKMSIYLCQKMYKQSNLLHRGAKEEDESQFRLPQSQLHAPVYPCPKDLAICANPASIKGFIDLPSSKITTSKRWSLSIVSAHPIPSSTSC